MSKKKLDFTSFYPDSIEIRNIEKDSDKITVHLKSYSQMQHCPICQNECRFHHSTYKRKLQDLPILGKQTIIRLTAYRYTCDHTDCEQKVFCETIDGFCGSYKRMTARLEDFLLTLVLHTSCEGASLTCPENSQTRNVRNHQQSSAHTASVSDYLETCAVGYDCTPAASFQQALLSQIRF